MIRSKRAIADKPHVELNMIWRGKLALIAALFAALFFIASARAADDAEALVKQGEGFLKDRNVPAAIEVYRKAVALKPDLESARQGLVTALADAGKIDDAIKECEELLHRYPKNPMNHRDYAALLYRQGKLEDSIAEMNEALRLNPDSVANRRELAQLFLRNSRFPEAEALWAEGIRRHPDDPDMHNQYGVVLARRGDPRAASA